jgi:threonylcarbamoyladenosine tRNA methylthiotransferase MtaB
MKVYLRTLGCRLNQSEIETMARQLRVQGHVIVDAPAEADHVVVNTCAVTHDASASSRRLVRQMHQANPRAAIIATGCHSEIAPHEIATLPGVAAVVANAEKARLVERMTGVPADPLDQEPLQRDSGGYIGRTRAFVKVQDGCDNACTFCITTVARGAGQSVPLAQVIAEANLLHTMGYQELVLTGVHLGSYGKDLGMTHGLHTLVEALLRETDVPRLRLSSLEPWDIEPCFFALWADARLCPHLHLPLQSGCDATLRRMARRTSQGQFAALVQAARQAMPDPCITTDLIVGFPGETEAEFAESYAFAERMQFAGMHVFRYSKRSGTAAARMRAPVPEPVKRERSAAMHALARAGQRAYAQRYVGRTLPVLWEQVAGATPDGFVNVGFTGNYLRVVAIDRRPLTHHLLDARLLEWDEALQQMKATPVVEAQSAPGIGHSQTDTGSQ